MAKDKAANPAQLQRKLEKQKALKKSKAEIAARRTEKLARRNPERLQRQLDDLKAAEAAGRLNLRDRKLLEDLERDVKAVRKAREMLGDKAPPLGDSRGGREGGRSGGNRGRGGSTLGKRRRDGGESDSSTTESVKAIPMPRDTPPPIPQEYLQKYGRDNANMTPLGDKMKGPRIPHPLPQKPETPTVQAKTVYEAKPAVRDLQKEAVSAFTPAAVQRKMAAKHGQGRLLEPEEADRLEKEGYGSAGGSGADRTAKDDSLDAAERELEEEAARFEREIRHHVQVEEVRDEDA